jgi:hypothetical protein
MVYPLSVAPHYTLTYSPRRALTGTNGKQKEGRGRQKETERMKLMEAYLA